MRRDRQLGRHGTAQDAAFHARLDQKRASHSQQPCEWGRHDQQQHACGQRLHPDPRLPGRLPAACCSRSGQGPVQAMHRTTGVTGLPKMGVTG